MLHNLDHLRILQLPPQPRPIVKGLPQVVGYLELIVLIRVKDKGDGGEGGGVLAHQAAPLLPLRLRSEAGG